MNRYYKQLKVVNQCYLVKTDAYAIVYWFNLMTLAVNRNKEKGRKVKL